MKTSYEGCDPKVAESLKKGEHFKCKMMFGNTLFDGKTIIIAYIKGYYVTDKRECINIANITITPIETETRVIGHVAMMQGLIERGYEPNPHGVFRLFHMGDPKDSDFFPIRLWQYCGTPIESTLKFEPWMIEEVEICT